MTYSEELIVAERRAEAAERKLADMRIILARAQADLARERDRAERYKVALTRIFEADEHDGPCCKCGEIADAVSFDCLAPALASEARNDAETCEVCAGNGLVRSPEPDGGTWHGPCPRCTKPTERGA